MKTFIVIPAYNEEKSITKVIGELVEFGYDNIVIVDDGSKDNTVQILKQQPVYLVEHVLNMGQGAALRTGTEYALSLGADVVVHFDADGQHQAKDIEKFVIAIEQGADLAIGSRFLGGEQQLPWSKKYLILKPAIIVNWLFSGLMLTDAHNGFRALSKHAAQKIQITQPGMAHNTEIPAEIKKHQLDFVEVPVEILYHEYGQSFGNGVKIIFDLIKRNLI